MTHPIVIDLPHSLGAAEAKRRIERNMGKLKDQIPGGSAVETDWAGDRLNLRVQAMGQDVRTRIDVRETLVRVELVLPPALGFFARPIEAVLRSKGSKMLEKKPDDRTS